MTDSVTPIRKPRPGLGRGLSALLGDATGETPAGVAPGDKTGIRMMSISALSPHPDQPRRRFDDDALEELARSIAERGVLLPLLVRPHGKDYQIVAGERRWRAAQRARLHEVPVIVREISDAETMELALVENIQRQDLNAIEEAEAYRKLIDQFGHTQEALARLVHKSRSHISNLLRLLDLPAPVREMLVEGSLEMGHARALIGAPDPVALARRAVDGQLSVREVEKLAREAKPGTKGKGAGNGASSGGRNADIEALERQLGDLLGLKVLIAHSDKGGTLSLGYSTLDQLDMLCQRLSGERI
jgi:ParB family chromosome partitioning protein